MSFKLNEFLERLEKEAEEKVAVGDSGITPDTASVKKPSELNHVETDDIREEQSDKVNAIINQMAMATQGGAQEILQNGNVVEQGGPEAPVSGQLPAEQMEAQEQAAAMAKSASDVIVEALYEAVYGEDSMEKDASQSVVSFGERVDSLTKIAAASEELLEAEYGDDYEAEDVAKLAMTLIEMEAEAQEEAEKYAEFEEAGAVMATSFYETLKRLDSE
jgi:hypothetical protein